MSTGKYANFTVVVFIIILSYSVVYTMVYGHTLLDHVTEEGVDPSSIIILID